MNLINQVKEELKKHIINKNLNRPKIILPESQDDRILEAASILSEEELIEIIILGSEPKIKQRAKEKNLKLEKIKIVDPEFDVYKQEYVKTYYELRKHKGINLEEASKKVSDYSTFSVMMVHTGRADGMVAGATWPTANTIRPALEIIKTKPDMPIASSYFIMETMTKKYLFADCAFIKNPDFEELAYIALETAKSAELLNLKPKIALLSFSTKGSGGDDESIKKIRKATKLFKSKRPDIMIEGEIQLDTAIVPEVNKLKCPECEVKGDANTLIFPDLNSGNIGYKLVQRFANVKATGPIIQGLKKPVNDLSRGCSVEDIINVTYITALEAIKQ